MQSKNYRNLPVRAPKEDPKYGQWTSLRGRRLTDRIWIDAVMIEDRQQPLAVAVAAAQLPVERMEVEGLRVGDASFLYSTSLPIDV